MNIDTIQFKISPLLDPANLFFGSPALIICFKIERSLFWGRLAKYKWPKKVILRKEAPRTSLGKSQNGDLR